MTAPDYLESWSKELHSRADRVRQLIGDAHWLSDGHHKEAILREFLRRYLPVHVQVSRGFIRRALTDDCSPEVDILIADLMANQPFFNEGDLLVVSPSSVIAHMEIKTKFGKSELLDALFVRREDSISAEQSSRFAESMARPMFLQCSGFSNCR